MHFVITFPVFFSAYVSVVYGVCNTLPVVDNAVSNVTTPGPYADGTVTQFICNFGFSPSGNRVFTCSGSSWVGGSYQCDPIYCGHVENPRNGYLLEQPTYEIGSFIKFGCDNGYTMKGKNQLVCTVDGEWIPREAPVCVIKDCGDFGSVAHGTAFQDIYTETNKYGSIVKVICDRGYLINGNSEVICDKNGNWDTKPTCTAVKCEHYPGLNSICVERSILTLNGRLLFMACKQDISSDVGPKYVKCENNKWKPDPDVDLMACFCDCKVDVNDSIMAVSNLINGYLKHGNELIWRCKNKGQKSTNQPLKCLDGKLTKPFCNQPDTSTKPYIPTGTQPTGVVVSTDGGTETNTSNLENKSKSNKTPYIVGGVFVGIVIVAGLVLIASFRLNKKRQEKKMSLLKFEQIDQHIPLNNGNGEEFFDSNEII